MKAAVLDGQQDGAKVERKDFQARDLLSLLVKSNMAADLPDDSRLSDDDVVARRLPTPVF